LDGVDVYVKFGPSVDPYFHIPMFDSTDGWQKAWFFLKNDVTAPLPTCTGNRPVPQLNWWYKVAKRDLHKLQCLCEVVQQLRQEGLTSVNLLRTIFNHRVLLLCQWVTTMWMYPIYEGLDDVEINIWIHKILAHGAILKPGGGPTALREGVDCTRLSPLGSVFGCSCEFQFLNALMSFRRVSCVLIAHRGGLPCLKTW
jgi:hypothetical protein